MNEIDEMAERAKAKTEEQMAGFREEIGVCSNGLLSCPFCAGKADETKGGRGLYTVTCWKCEFDGPDFNTREAANAAWNSRAG